MANDAVQNIKAKMSEPQINRSGTTKAMLTMAFAMLLIPVMDAIAKKLATSHGMSPASITWVRFFGQSLLLFLIIPLWLGATKLKTKNTGANIFRGMLIGVAVTIFFLTVKYLPLADAIAIFFVEPLILMLLSAVFLREKVGWRRMLAAVFGFAGALFVIEPSFEIFGLISLLPLVTATLFAVYLILSRKLGSNDHAMTMQLWSGIGGVIICSLMIVMGEMTLETNFRATLPQTTDAILLLLLLIVIGTLGHLMIVVAFSKTQASILAPFQYLEIITTTALGYWLFGDFPSFNKWIGIAMIITSGFYIFYREQKLEKLPLKL